jgi:hypothetical protein
MVRDEAAHCVGYVNMNGVLQKLWFWRESGVMHLQHEAEISEIEIRLQVDDVLRFSRIPKEMRKTLSPDALIQVNGNTFVWEHDRGTENEDQIKAKMHKLSQFDGEKMWTVPDRMRLDMLKELAPDDRHWFTTYDEAVTNPHGQIWETQSGLKDSLEISTRYSDQHSAPPSSSLS